MPSKNTTEFIEAGYVDYEICPVCGEQAHRDYSDDPNDFVNTRNYTCDHCGISLTK